MSRYIDADEFYKKLKYNLPYDPFDVITEIQQFPTADVVEVVRCKDCKYAKYTDYALPECRWYCKNSTNYHSGSFFCSLGERGEE